MQFYQALQKLCTPRDISIIMFNAQLAFFISRRCRVITYKCRNVTLIYMLLNPEVRVLNLRLDRDWLS